ncbi:MAG: hypothetical protein IT336_06170, partial [Thermomicrobiales bacterium]|nr:hypothetical protein [Thermomicrobiales bacterium]
MDAERFDHFARMLAARPTRRLLRKIAAGSLVGAIAVPSFESPRAQEAESTSEPTSTPIPTETPSPEPTATPTPIPTEPPTPTELPTSTPTATVTQAPTATETPTSTPTSTPVPSPTATNTVAPTATPTPTSTPIPTATPTPSPAPVNLIRNPGFEQGNIYWYTENGAGAVSGDARTGTLAMRVPPGGFVGQFFNAVAGATYTLSAWGKMSAGGNSALLGVIFWNASGVRLVSEEPAPAQFTASSYGLATLVFVVPSAAAQFEIFVWKGAGTASAYIDDVAVVRGGSPVEPSPTPTSTATSTPTSSSTATPTVSSTPTATNTPTISTATATPTPTGTAIATPTQTLTPTPTGTATVTAT